MSTILIGLTGRKRSGKDTVAGFLREEGFDRVAFGDPIKEILADMDPLLSGTRRSGSVTDIIEFGQLLSGLLGAIPLRTSLGKVSAESVAEAVNILDPFVTPADSYRPVRLTDLLREVDGDWDQLKDEEGNPHHREIRRLQQVLGTEVGREVLGASIWVDTGMEKVAKAHARGVPVVITDCRFDNEAEAVRAAGGKVVRVVRPSLPAPTDGHASESGISEHLVDREIVNDGTLDDLRAASEELARWAA